MLLEKIMKNTLLNKRSVDIVKFISNLNLDKRSKEELTTSKINNLLIINEALTHSSANNSINYENLEFLGDAVLRLIASDFIKKKYPRMKVGERSELRSQLVSDQWLENVGTSIHISKILIIGPKALGDRSARATIQAEATEALIGALYEILGRLDPIKNWLTPFWSKRSEEVLSDPHRENYKSALQEWSQGKGYSIPKYETNERDKEHANPNRFFCTVYIEDHVKGEGFGGSIKQAEKEAAKHALGTLDKNDLLDSNI